jgi:carbon-monoxide dehydrogenase medium subunit
MWKQYITPATLEEALSLLAEHQPQARIIAGGTDVLVELEHGGHPQHTTLIDITRIPDLDTVTLSDDGWVHLGPLVTQNHVVGSPVALDHGFPLAQASWSEAAPQIRNRATVAGNVITASPANDTIPALLTLGAQLRLRSAEGERVVPLEEFYTGFRQTVMKPDEILTDIAFPAMASHERGIFLKLGLRRAQAIAVVNIAVVLDVRDEHINEARVAYGSIAPTVFRASIIEHYLTGKPFLPGTIEGAVALAGEVGSPIDDVRGPATYRRAMIARLLRRALTTLLEGDEREGFPTAPVMLWGAQQARVTEPQKATVHHDGTQPIDTTINGETVTIRGGSHKTLLHMLREDAGLPGTKEGCSEGECGACTVFLDGAAVMACMVPAPRAHNADVVTIEGLAANGELHPVQRGFVTEGAVQCGYCTPGFVMAGAKLLEERPTPTTWDVQQSITGNLCRCTGYYKIIDAIERAAELTQPTEE